MKAMISIGSEFVPGIFSDIGEAVCNILKTARENDMDQETTRAALQILPSITKVEHVAVTNSNFTARPKQPKKGKSKKSDPDAAIQLGEDGS